MQGMLFTELVNADKSKFNDDIIAIADDAIMHSCAEYTVHVL